MNTFSMARPLQLLLALSVVVSACSSASNTETVETQAPQAVDQQETKQLLVVGTYTRKEGHVDGKADGIYVYEFDLETGNLTQVSTSPPIVNPSYLTIHPSSDWVYAVSETGGESENEAGTVQAFRLDRSSGRLGAINAVSSEGDYPCYVSIDQTGGFAMVANYGGGIALLPIEANGELQEATTVIQHSGKGPTPRQEAPHAHMIVPGPNEKFIYAVDLGTDKIYTYTLDALGEKLIPAGEAATLEPGSGPRHLTFHPINDFAYVVNELSGTITAFKVDSVSGALESFQTISTIPGGISGQAGSADIHIHPSGQYLYASNRGDMNNIAMFEINQTSGVLKLMGHQPTFGLTPRNFVIHPNGEFLLVANQDSGNVVTFRIDENTGLLQETGINTEIPTPVCLKFVD
ncbi:lactonase family protein [Cesiribacter sp. SM1]|uniref:lactonase family protein n=1 Tax=Cesiribacter sp. SM1 TaxID=2861196 RepID=UPI001CD1D7CA|nr:lactonase family protein [Cesiribacter sp. SM1]